jgi:hypothetical protein
MHFTKLIPNIFYTDINVGIRFFTDCLGFTMGHNELQSDQPYCVIKKDNLSILLFQNKAFAEKNDRPEFRLVTDNIETVYEKVAATHPEYLHPNLKVITLRPWGAKEFALKDESDVCIIIQEW